MRSVCSVAKDNLGAVLSFRREARGSSPPRAPNRATIDWHDRSHSTRLEPARRDRDRSPQEAPDPGPPRLLPARARVPAPLLALDHLPRLLGGAPAALGDGRDLDGRVGRRLHDQGRDRPPRRVGPRAPAGPAHGALLSRQRGVGGDRDPAREAAHEGGSGHVPRGVPRLRRPGGPPVRGGLFCRRGGGARGRARGGRDRRPARDRRALDRDGRGGRASPVTVTGAS